MQYSVLKGQPGGLSTHYIAAGRRDGQNLQACLIVYAFVNSELSEQQIIELTTSLPIQIKATVMSSLDVFVETGRKQKTENAVRNLIKQSLLTDKQIASLNQTSHCDTYFKVIPDLLNSML